MSSSTPFQFEAAMKELETIAVWFEGNQVNLDDGLAKFERGMELSAQLREHLEEVGNRVERVKAKFDLPSLTQAEGALVESPDSQTLPELF